MRRRTVIALVVVPAAMMALLAGYGTYRRRARMPIVEVVVASKGDVVQTVAAISASVQPMEFVENLKRNFHFFERFLVVLTCAAAGITTGILIYTNIQHKRRTIGILKAIGTKNSGVLSLFLVEGLVIGLAGVALGDLLGGSLAYYMSRHPVGVRMTVVTWPSFAKVSPGLFVFPSLLILGTTVVAACYPAWRAARMEILKSKARAAKLLELVGLGDRAKHRPGQLSGGQQQRVSIARALINRPALLLADEPTANLDSVRAREIVELLIDLNRRSNQTIVLVTHEDEYAAMAHRVITVRDGRIVQGDG